MTTSNKAPNPATAARCERASTSVVECGIAAGVIAEAGVAAAAWDDTGIAGVATVTSSGSGARAPGEPGPSSARRNSSAFW